MLQCKSNRYTRSRVTIIGDASGVICCVASSCLQKLNWCDCRYIYKSMIILTIMYLTAVLSSCITGPDYNDNACSREEIRRRDEERALAQWRQSRGAMKGVPRACQMEARQRARLLVGECRIHPEKWEEYAPDPVMRQLLMRSGHSGQIRYIMSRLLIASHECDL